MSDYTLGISAMKEDCSVGMQALELYRIGKKNGNSAYEAERQRILDNHGQSRLELVDCAFSVIAMNPEHFGEA